MDGGTERGGEGVVAFLGTSGLGEELEELTSKPKKSLALLSINLRPLEDAS